MLGFQIMLLDRLGDAYPSSHLFGIQARTQHPMGDVLMEELELKMIEDLTLQELVQSPSANLGYYFLQYQ
jgi:hypothetical protein